MAEELKQVRAQSLECPVCLNIFKDPKILSCSHTFCKTCLDNLLGCHGDERKLRCPVCRADTQVPNQDISQLQSNLVLKSLIEDVENQHQKGKCLSFERKFSDELGLGKIVNYAAKNVVLPTGMNGMNDTPDGRMAVGTLKGGIAIFSADGQLQQTVLKDVQIQKLGFISGDRCVVRDTGNNITLYTKEWKKLDVKFETLNYNEGGYGGMDVDNDDQIYVGYRKAKKIQVFSSIGGKAIREITCDGYCPERITMFGDLLITGDICTIIIDKDGTIKQRAKPYGYPIVAVTQDNRILIAWVNHDEKLVSIDEYNKKLQHVKTIISQYKIEKAKRFWYYLREFRSGEIAFCAPNRLYIFNMEI